MENNYIYLFFTIILFTLIAFLFIILSYVFVLQQENKEKISAYECGFQPFADTRNKFDIKYYLIAILFIIFDLELIYLLPWILSLFEIGYYGIFSMIIFLIILTIGFIYEWKRGALEWD